MSTSQVSFAVSVSRRAARAHALKNCLTVIAAVNQLVEHELSEVARERLSRSRAAAQRMLALIEEDLLPDGVTRSLRELVNVANVANAVVERVKDRAQIGCVKLHVRCGQGDVIGDGPALAEALGNIVLNAVEATPPDGAVLVVTSELRRGAQLWVVQDSGPGIAAHLLEQWGTPYASFREGGTGIGVAFAREVVERHGGFIRLESASGTGTCVSIWLPRQCEGVL